MIMSRHVSVSGSIIDEFQLAITQVELRDQLSQPFVAQVELVSQQYHTDFNRLLGQALTLTFHLHHGHKKYLNGLVTQFRYQHHQGQYYTYLARLEPALALLAYQSDHRIFQNLSVPDIVNTLFKEHGFSAELRFVEQYPPRVYCVQYRESQLHFIHRLLEEEGIYYSFIHSADKHQLVLYDYNGKHDFLPAHQQLRYDPYTRETPQPTYRVNAWHPQLSIQTGSYSLKDYNYKAPQLQLNAISQEPRPFAHGDYERYDYQGPEHYTAQGHGDRYATIRLQEQQCQVSRVFAQSNSSGVEVGHLLRLTEHPNQGQNQDYLILENHLQVKLTGYQSGGGDTDLEIINHFTALPDSDQYRPLRRSPKQRVTGPQTAVVVGPPGEEIYTDQYGRVKCQFHWDRRGKSNENSSCWIRVSHNWGGGGWGHIAIPRIGHEVVVDFLEGDPDQPIITGRTYNGNNQSTYKLPEHKTRMTVRSDTHKGEGFNELRFEDEAGQEEIYIHAQKDHNTKIENHRSERVNSNKVESVGHNKGSEIGNNLIQVVDGNMELRVGPGNSGTFTPASAEREPQGIPMVPERLGEPAVAEKGVGDLLLAVEKNKVQTVGENHDEVVGGDKRSQVQKNYSLDVYETIEINAGNKMVLNCGRSRIVLNADGTITFNGRQISQVGDSKIEILSDIVKVN